MTHGATWCEYWGETAEKFRFYFVRCAAEDETLLAFRQKSQTGALSHQPSFNTNRWDKINCWGIFALNFDVFPKLNCFEWISPLHGSAENVRSVSRPPILSLLSLFAIVYFDFWWELDKQMFIFCTENPSLSHQKNNLPMFVYEYFIWFLDLRWSEWKFITCSVFPSSRLS